MDKPVGLILAGGQSQRMGKPKAWIDYHGMPQVEWLSDLLQPYCSSIIVSLNDEPIVDYDLNIQPDLPEFAGHGPMSGILTAFEKTDHALLVVGCDYPYLDVASVELILAARKAPYAITCFKNEQGFVEPLIACYEIEAKNQLLSFFQNGSDSLTRFIKSTNAQIITCPNPKILISADSPDFVFTPD